MSPGWFQLSYAVGLARGQTTIPKENTMDQTADANKAMIRRFVEDVKNKRHFEQIGEIFRA